MPYIEATHLQSLRLEPLVVLELELDQFEVCATLQITGRRSNHTTGGADRSRTAAYGQS